MVAENLSAVINPFNYGSGKTIEVICLECTQCGEFAKKRLPHSMPDTKIIKKFKGWTAAGVFGAKATRCPECRGIKGVRSDTDS